MDAPTLGKASFCAISGNFFVLNIHWALQYHILYEYFAWGYFLFQVPPTAPVFKYQSSGQSVKNKTLEVVEGDTFSVACVSAANPPAEYSWTGNLSSNGAVLTMTNVSKGEYALKCRARNTMTETIGQVNILGTNESILAVNVLCTYNFICF